MKYLRREVNNAAHRGLLCSQIIVLELLNGEDLRAKESVRGV